VSEAVPYQSFYRRYRPQRFEDCLGQEHVSQTLRNAVRTSKVAHAYLFSGPRGCGKTTSARILAKALNCTNLQDGEPCGVCDSCKLVTSGASLDVTELDAASNNGVDAMRDLVARVALGTSGRRKVYIVDEVHMLSTAAANALLKTLEEPPEHVVFVLATTDPQKVLPTIKSRTQHFEFRLFPVATLIELLNKVLADAGIDLDAATIEAVARRGNGSARDTLSALDQVVAAGGFDDRSSDIASLVSALSNRDVAAALSAVDELVSLGRDSRQIARDLQEALRSGFLATVVPGGLPSATPSAHSELARKLGAASCVRGIELFGDALIAMREAMDPRVLLEVAVVRLANPALDPSPAALLERLDRLERMLAGGGPALGPALARPPAPTAPPLAAAAPVAAPAPAPAPGLVPSSAPASPTTEDAAPPDPPPPAAPPAASVGGLAPPPPRATSASSMARPSGQGGAANVLAERTAAGPAARPARPSPSPTRPPAPAAAPAMPSAAPTVPSAAPAGDAWGAALEAMPKLTKAMYAGTRRIAGDPDEIRLAAPNEAHLSRCEERRAEAEAAVAAAFPEPMRITLVIDAADGSALPSDTGDDDGEAVAPARQRVQLPPRPAPTKRTAPPPVAAAQSTSDVDEHFDPSELLDAPDVSVASTKDLMLSAFPGAELVEEDPR
jgi:DNA polymerase III subunit gamma/tau